MKSLFASNEVCEAKDLIIFILQQLHKELIKPININQNNNNNQNIEFNQYDQEKSLLFYINEFKMNWSIIYDIFSGFMQTTNECLNCKELYRSQNLKNPICYNYELFNCLIFPLEEIKNNNNISNISFSQNQSNMNNSLSIYDCFEYYQKSEILKNRCNLCQQYSNFIFSSKLYYGPNILILILNREKDNINKINLYIQENIDISNYILDKDMNNMIYNLYGVISYIGESGPSTYFVASCKSFIDNNWYRFKDTIVSQIYNIQKDVIEYGTPYILFYKKQKYEENILDKYKFY